MGEGGDIVFRVDADDKSAQQKLNQLRKDIERTARSIETTQGKKNGIEESLERAREKAQQTAEEINRVQAQIQQNASEIQNGKIQGDAAIHIEDYNRLMDANRQLGEQKAVLNSQLAAEQKEVAKLEGQEQRVLTTLQQQTSQLEAQKAQAGQLQGQLAQQSVSTMPQLGKAVSQVSASFKKSLMTILKWGFGIRSVFILVRRLRSYIKDAVTSFAAGDEETRNNINMLKSSLATLKASWGAAFAPILNAVAPILKQLIDWMTAAANAVAHFMAVLTGKGTYKKAIANNNALASSVGGAGAAAEEAEKQLMGFDEINKLNAQNSGGGGGGGGGANNYLEEDVDLESFPAKMAIAMKDVLFNWDDLNAESIMAKCLAGLTTLGGAFVGGMIGGVPGIIIGSIAGLLLGVALDATVFNFDGQLSKEELFTALALALPVVGGAVIGFMMGGPVGAAIGIGIGLVIDFIAFKIGIDKIKQAISDWYHQVIDYFQGYINKWRDLASGEAKEDGHYIVFGILEGILHAMAGIGAWIWDHIGQPIIDAVKKAFGIHSPSTVMMEIGNNIIAGLLEGIKEKWDGIRSWLDNAWQGLKHWWGNLSLGAFDLKLPHITYSLVTVPVLGTIPDPRTLAIEWYARGGIVDGATLIGAGEAGKEAIIPLERHTEWINMVADALIDRLTSRRGINAMAGLAMPALASGTIVPPNAYNASGSAFSEADIGSLVSAIVAGINTTNDNPRFSLYIDGEQITNVVTKRQNNNSRRAGR